MSRRKLSLDNENHAASWSMKQREANRRIVDTRNNLEKIYERQRNLNEAARIAELERRNQEIDKKIQVNFNRLYKLMRNYLKFKTIA